MIAFKMTNSEDSYVEVITEHNFVIGSASFVNGHPTMAVTKQSLWWCLSDIVLLWRRRFA